MRTALVLDTIDQAIWTRQREGIADLTGLDAAAVRCEIAFGRPPP